MALRWLLHSACHALGQPHEDHTVINHENGVVKTPTKVSNNVRDASNDGYGFQMPLHYPRYQKADYENMEEWKIDMLLREYGLVHFKGSLDDKRAFAVGAFLWPDQL